MPMIKRNFTVRDSVYDVTFSHYLPKIIITRLYEHAKFKRLKPNQITIEVDGILVPSTKELWGIWYHTADKEYRFIRNKEKRHTKFINYVIENNLEESPGIQKLYKTLFES